MAKQIQGLKSGKTIVDVVNAIRSEVVAKGNTGYGQSVPFATYGNLSEVANPIMNFDTNRNDFINSLVNRIAMTLVKNASFTNPLAILKKGTLELGETIEEVFIGLCEEHDFEGQAPEDNLGDQYAKFEVEHESVFHTINRKKYYPITISEVKLKKAFTSWEGLETFVAGLIQSAYTTDYLNEFIVMKSMISFAIKNGHVKQVVIEDITNKETAEDFAIALRTYGNQMTFLSRDFNKSGVANNTPIDKQVLLIDPKFEASIGVRLLASAFNMSEADYMQRRILIDNFYDLASVKALLVSEDWFEMRDSLFETRRAENARHLFYNFFLHHHQMLSYSWFENAICFTTEAITPIGG